jgi:hypothetical protein
MIHVTSIPVLSRTLFPHGVDNTCKKMGHVSCQIAASLLSALSSQRWKSRWELGLNLPIALFTEVFKESGIYQGKFRIEHAGILYMVKDSGRNTINIRIQCRP